MGFIIGLLAFALILVCVAVVLLVLIQLPKGEFGAGSGFGSATTDAMLGAGSGSVLTRITRYAATAFFVLALLLSIPQTRGHSSGSRVFLRALPPAAAPAQPQ